MKLDNETKIELTKQIAIGLAAWSFPAGVSFLGAQLYRPLTPSEVAHRASIITEEVAKRVEELGWI